MTYTVTDVIKKDFEIKMGAPLLVYRDLYHYDYIYKYFLKFMFPTTVFLFYTKNGSVSILQKERNCSI